jgi:glutamate formiminotransferase
MNCNVTIETQDLRLGKEIAAAIRATSPKGLRGVQAMAFAHEGSVEIACNVEAFYLDDAVSTEDNLVRSFGQCFHVPASAIQERIADLAARHDVETRPAAIVGFSPKTAQETARHAIKNGQMELWKTRSRQM